MAAWAKRFFRLEWAVMALSPRWRFIFVLRASDMFYDMVMTASAVLTVGFEIYLCLNIPCLISLSPLSFEATCASNDNARQR